MNELEKIQKYISLLSDKIYVHEAGTGTLYLEYNGKHIRVADHEPNYGARDRSHDYKELYVKDACNSVIDAELNIDYIAEYFDIEIEGELRTIIDAYEDKKVELAKLRKELELKEAERIKSVAEKRLSLREKVGDRVEKVLEFILEAERVAEAAKVNKTNTRKKRMHIFASLFEKEFGFTASIAEAGQTFSEELYEYERKCNNKK